METEKKLLNSKKIGQFFVVGKKKGTDIQTPINNVVFRPPNELLYKMTRQGKLRIINYEGFNCIEKCSLDEYIIKLIEEDLS